MSTADDWKARFGGIERLYGAEAAALLRGLRVCVVGIGGVGSWAAEALARSGIGHLTLIDPDDIVLSNINRQVHTLSDTLGQPKVAAMAERVAAIHPGCDCQPVDDFLTLKNLPALITTDFDYVIDAIDSIRFKAALIYHCKRNRIPVIATGGAGGLTDPTRVQVADLTRTYNDPLAAKVRSRLRADHGWTRNPKRRFGVECVFSPQQQLYPRGDGRVGHARPGVQGVTLDCNLGYGSTSLVTATFGLVAASRAIERSVRRKLGHAFARD